MRLTFVSAIFFLAGTNIPALAAPPRVQKEQVCDASTLNAVGSLLGFDTSRFSDTDTDRTVVIAAACKTHPEKPHITVTAIAFDNGKTDAKDIVIALIDTTKHAAIASFRSEIVENEVMQLDHHSLKIDTAPYKLAPGVRAIGVDVISGYTPHCAEGGSGPERTLYVQDGQQLRPVYVLAMSYWSFIQGGNPRCWSDPINDNSVIEHTDLSISIADSITNGFHDLIVTGTTSEEGDGKPQKKSSFRYRALYENLKYRDQKQ